MAKPPGGLKVVNAEVGDEAGLAEGGLGILAQPIHHPPPSLSPPRGHPGRLAKPTVVLLQSCPLCLGSPYSGCSTSSDGTWHYLRVSCFLRLFAHL